MRIQTLSHAAQAMRSGAFGACAAAAGLWRMQADAQPQAVIDSVVINGKSRAHRVQGVKI